MSEILGQGRRELIEVKSEKSERPLLEDLKKREASRRYKKKKLACKVRKNVRKIFGSALPCHR